MKPILSISLGLVLASGVGLADVIKDWNLVLLQATETAPVTPAPITTRVAAIVQAAVFDAVNGIERHYSPIFVQPAAPSGASVQAAAVEAAYVTLVDLYPAQKATFDQQRTASLAQITDNNIAVQQGLAWGQTVANEIWTWKSQDGFSNTVPPYLGGTNPGQWQPTPPAMAPGLDPQLATTTPWVMRSPAQFRLAGPPALTSDQFTADFNETKNMGAATNSGRTADQTLSANFWQAGNPPDYWDQAVVSLAEQNSYSISDEARLLALVNLGMADAMIGCWDSKYTYSSWRPITAIQFTGSDGNNATVADPSWTPLVVTPPFPEYPSAHSCASGAAAHILSETFGEATSFAIVTLAMPGVMRQYHNFSEALADVANARVFGGIHFRTATTDGTSLGISVGDYVMQNALLAEDEKKHH
ncbi:MAG TPA: vanadium-dependent haloperoxidase [Bryobacteraceae bacterium]|nr:vanadium-dependent haloperoxidase [Bryobacteraceae bacterium]